MGQIAEDEHGVVSRAELLGAGISSHEIEWRLRTGALLEEYPGTYRVGHRAPSTAAAYMAAVKATGKGTLLAGLAAAYHWRLIKGQPPPPEVISLTERRVPGIVTHRARRQPGADARVHLRIPITSVGRTLVDLAAILEIDPLAQACHEAGVKYDTTPAEVKAVLSRRPTAKGARKLRRIMEGEFKVALSKLERASSHGSGRLACRCQSRTRFRGATVSTADGPPTASPLNWIRTATTTPAGRGRWTAAESEKPGRGATTFAATPTTT